MRTMVPFGAHTHTVWHTQGKAHSWISALNRTSLVGSARVFITNSNQQLQHNKESIHVIRKKLSLPTLAYYSPDQSVHGLPSLLLCKASPLYRSLLYPPNQVLSIVALLALV